jgi:hypothetical protein
MVRIIHAFHCFTFSAAPKEHRQFSPGQRPGNAVNAEPIALKGRNDGQLRLLFRPFRASNSTQIKTPGRCPGLVCSGPFRAEDARKTVTYNSHDRTSLLQHKRRNEIS